MMDPFPVSPAAPLILLVDDHGPCLDLMKAVLERAGYRCATARSGAEAIALCCVGLPEAVVTDLGMTDIDGRELGRWFRSSHPEVPLVLVTAEDMESDQVERSRPLFDLILSKPIDLERLLDALQGSIAATARSGLT